jgi:hypothetical protein
MTSGIRYTLANYLRAIYAQLNRSPALLAWVKLLLARFPRLRARLITFTRSDVGADRGNIPSFDDSLLLFEDGQYGRLTELVMSDIERQAQVKKAKRVCRKRSLKD